MHKSSKSYSKYTAVVAGVIMTELVEKDSLESHTISPPLFIIEPDDSFMMELYARKE